MEIEGREARTPAYRTRNSSPDPRHLPPELDVGPAVGRSERLLLGHNVAEATVAKYVVRSRKPPSQAWRTFLADHFPDIAACDFFTVPTVAFRVLYVFIGLGRQLRKIAISAILGRTHGKHHVH